MPCASLLNPFANIFLNNRKRFNPFVSLSLSHVQASRTAEAEEQMDNIKSQLKAVSVVVYFLFVF